jgi:WD40 repeat protein
MGHSVTIMTGACGSKGNRRGHRLVACLFNENRVVIREFETGEEHELKVEYCLHLAASSRYIAATTNKGGVHLFSHDGELVQEVLCSESTISVGFHSRNPSILAIGFESGTIRIWDARARAYVSSFKEHTDYVLRASFTHDGLLLLSSADKSASLVRRSSSNRVSSLKVICNG